jgi:Ras-related protein Rab-2A
MKVVLVGDQFVNKTSLLNCLTNGNTSGDVRPTMSTNLTVHQVFVRGSRQTLNIWETAGEAHYRSLASRFLRNARGILVILGLTTAQSRPRAPGKESRRAWQT